MFSNLSRIPATSLAPHSQGPHSILPRLPLILGIALCLSGCHTKPATSLTPARSLTGPSSAIAQVQSTPLYRQARQDCQRKDYGRAADTLLTLSKTPGLAPDVVAYVQRQRDICLQDAGVPVAASPAASSPKPSPIDADCGPHALLFLCQQLDVKTNLETLRQSAGTTAQGTTMDGLQQAAQKLGLRAEGVQVSREALPDISTPAIAWDRRQHFIVVLALSGNGESAKARIHDPNRPTEETISQENLLQRCGGFLLL
ncbi:MAG: ATP-binding cassette protein, partial [Chthonomonadales bacterium]|nr:ATP-binding cassette protein [Chthonomonadales bacterium]